MIVVVGVVGVITEPLWCRIASRETSARSGRFQLSILSLLPEALNSEVWERVAS